MRRVTARRAETSEREAVALTPIELVRASTIGGQASVSRSSSRFLLAVSPLRPFLVSHSIRALRQLAPCLLSAL